MLKKTTQLAESAQKTPPQMVSAFFVCTVVQISKVSCSYVLTII